jgi:integrator complex subunit 11
MNEIIDVVLITHFHLDHCGALPFLTEIVGYDGNIVMASPTKAILIIIVDIS